MASSELIEALQALAHERKIDEFYLIDRLEASLAKSYQHILDLEWDARVTIDRQTGKIYVYELVPVGEPDEETGEYSASKSRLAYAFSSVGSPEVMNGLSASDYLWTVQRKVILDLAEKGNCVIVGRCADYILEDRDDVLNVFVHAGKDYRAKRIVLLYGETDKPPAKRLAEKDKKRALNYRHYTGREWGDVHNYDLSLDSGRLTPEGCVEIITRVVQEKNK